METEEQVAEFETVPRYVREAVELKTSVRKLYRKRSMRKKRKKKRNGNVAMKKSLKSSKRLVKKLEGDRAKSLKDRGPKLPKLTIARFRIKERISTA